MKIPYLLVCLLLLISCNQLGTKPDTATNSEKKLPSEDSGVKINITAEKDNTVNTKPFKFDNTIVPKDLANFVEEKFDSLRLPTENDYEIKYFERNKEKGQPFFCSGYFNNDTLIDYALVLIKDSLSHYVFAFHTNQESFDYYILDNRPFNSEYESERDYAIFDLSTETDRTISAIDTVYNIETDAINMADIYDSRTRTKVWDNDKKIYTRIFFD